VEWFKRLFKDAKWWQFCFSNAIFLVIGLGAGVLCWWLGISGGKQAESIMEMVADPMDKVREMVAVSIGGPWIIGVFSLLTKEKRGFLIELCAEEIRSAVRIVFSSSVGFGIFFLVILFTIPVSTPLPQPNQSSASESSNFPPSDVKPKDTESPERPPEPAQQTDSQKSSDKATGNKSITYYKYMALEIILFSLILNALFPCLAVESKPIRDYKMDA